ncbi:MAG: peptidylprolyl isomerase [Verrucomicrobia bacterium]|nr:peptidylprolyl isomerase [Verrucomicrobiota bacterium]
MTTRAISFHYTLTDPRGETLDSSAGRDPLTFIEGKGQIIPGLESQLSQLNLGDKKRLLVKAADGYGIRNPQLVFEVTKERLPTQEIKVGDKFRSQASPVPLLVTQVTDSHVTLDANHPLADVDLTFDVEITGVREATEEELAGCGQGCCGSHSHGCCDEKPEDHGQGCCGH